MACFVPVSRSDDCIVEAVEVQAPVDRDRLQLRCQGYDRETQSFPETPQAPLRIEQVIDSRVQRHRAGLPRIRVDLDRVRERHEHESRPRVHAFTMNELDQRLCHPPGLCPNGVWWRAIDQVPQTELRRGQRSVSALGQLPLFLPPPSHFP